MTPQTEEKLTARQRTVVRILLLVATMFGDNEAIKTEIMNLSRHIQVNL
jgi:hypothetical protein